MVKYISISYNILLVFFLVLKIGIISAQSNSALLESNIRELPISNIRNEEIYQLINKGVIMNSLDSYRDIRLQPKSFETKTIIEHYKKLRPNFLAEAIFIMPVKVGEEQDILRDVMIFLQSVKTFGDIPYYSKQNDTWNPMFENIIIKELPVFADGSEGIITEQIMRPFKPYTSVYGYNLSENIFLYENYNSTPLYYKWMKGVDKEEMSTTLFVQAYSGYLFFYGLGGAKAFDFFGLFGKRLDVAFTGRIEAFFEWFHQEFVLEIQAE